MGTAHASIGDWRSGHIDDERAARNAAELARLKTQYGTNDAQRALQEREAEIARETDVIAKTEASVATAPLAPDPPMSSDESLKWKSESIGGVTRVASTFETMKGGTVAIVLRLDTVPEESLPWIGVLPTLVRNVGVVRDGAPIPYDEVADRIRREVLGVNAYLSTRTSTARAELSFEASGNSPDETARALAWTRDFLVNPDWRPENLPRIRDVLAETFAKLHDTMADTEEHWLYEAEETYRRQDRAVFTHANGFLTQVYDAFVVSWRLEGGEDAKGVAPFLKTLGTAGKKLDRASLAKLAEALAANDDTAKVDPKIASWVRSARALPKAAQPRAQKAGRDLGALLGDIPDGSLAADWAALCDEMARDVSRSPSEELGQLRKTLAAIRHTANARVWTVGSSRTQRAIVGDIEQTLATLDPLPAPGVDHGASRFVLDRARARGASGAPPFVALVNPNLGTAALNHFAPSAALDTTREDALIDYLAVNVFDGEGVQSFYQRIYGAALAYGGYLSTRLNDAEMNLYADRCADLPQLLRFVDSEVRNARTDARYVDYALVRAFWSRGADSFETRARGIAADLVDGLAPDRVRASRERLLALRQRPGLAEAMHARYVPAMSAVIPSLLGTAPTPEGALYFVVGREPQIAAYEGEIERTRGADVKVLRVWPRDFWDVRTDPRAKN